MLGKKHTEESKQKNRISHLGKKIFRKPGTYAGEKNSMFGKHHSEKTKKIIGRKRSEYYKLHPETLGKSALGKHWKLSEETKKKMRISSINYIKNICGEIWPRLGRNEKQILDKLEQELDCKILRQYEVEGYFLDGYISEINVAIEVDERPKIRTKDIQREKNIKEKLNCKFIRIKDYD